MTFLNKLFFNLERVTFQPLFFHFSFLLFLFIFIKLSENLNLKCLQQIRKSASFGLRLSRGEQSKSHLLTDPEDGRSWDTEFPECSAVPYQLFGSSTLSKRLPLKIIPETEPSIILLFCCIYDSLNHSYDYWFMCLFSLPH